jgi:hypothetical protein
VPEPEPSAIVFGRGHDCDIVVVERSVSGRHARLAWDGPKLLLEDLGSANGTWLDGERIEREHVKIGADVRLGATPLPWGDPAMRPFLRRGGLGDTILAMPRFGRYRCPSCKKLGVLPPGFQRGEIACPSCNTALVFGATAPRSTWTSWAITIVMLGSALLAAGLVVTSEERMARVRDVVGRFRGDVPVAIPGAAPVAPSATIGGATPEEEAIRVHDVPGVLRAIDPSDPITRNLAVQIASEENGPFQVEQVARIWTHDRAEWDYVNDPRGGEYFARASETITNGFAGDCDDFAITLAAMIEAIGGRTRIVMMDGPEGGHAYTEACIDDEPTEIARRLSVHFRRHWDRRLGRQQAVREISYRSDSSCRAWLNLDWNAPVPGGPYGNERWAVAIYTDGHTESLTPGRAPVDAGVR